jgi:hypothetical protein
MTSPLTPRLLQQRAQAQASLQTTPGGLVVAAGLTGGGQVRGWLDLRGSGRVVDVLTNWPEPTVTLGSGPDGQGRGRIVLLRSALAWIGALEREPMQAGSRAHDGAVDDPTAPSAQAVMLHVGPFEMHGRIHAYADVNWSDLLMATRARGGFIAVADARISGPQGSLELPTVAVNSAHVQALFSHR